MTDIRQERRLPERPFFSICIPQYNRTSFLLYALERLKNQTLRDFEVCISDDCSTDGRGQEILQFLMASGMAYVYEQRHRNVRYDGNLRASIALAQGQYVWLMGNDDCLAQEQSLEKIRRAMSDTAHRSLPAVVLTNYREFDSGRLRKRVRQPGWREGNSQTAARVFRNFSFVSGILLETDAAQRQATAEWDGSEMYQVYLACRLLASGGGLLTVEEPAVLQGIHMANEHVDSYARKPRLDPCPIVERVLPLSQLGRVVWAAIEPFTTRRERGPYLRSIFLQILVLTYPFWLFEYRRVQSWKYAAGVALGMRPRNLWHGVPLAWWDHALLTAVHALVSGIGLAVPLRFFDRMYPRLYALAKMAAR